ncbi:hypothetical protein CELL_01987 [Cellulomonas sp. T2.31MG-18]
MRVRWWIALIAALSIVALIALVVPWPSGTLRDVASRFSPAEGTENGPGTYEPSRLFCLGDNSCPSVHRSWTAPSPVTTEQLQTRIDAAGYDAKVEGNCSSGSCIARGSAQGWSVTIVAFRNAGEPATEVSLSVGR